MYTMYRKLYTRNRAPGKAVQPPTVDGISRAKSLTSLISTPDSKVCELGPDYCRETPPENIKLYFVIYMVSVN